MQKITNNILLQSALSAMPRLLTQLDRNRNSHTYGCWDRNFWHYRTSDFSCARYQEAVRSLALLYTHPFENNIYYGNPLTKEWINASLAYTKHIMHRDGSFDEWYPREGSFVATAFVTASIGEILTLMPPNDIKNREQYVTCITRSVDWLIRRHEHIVWNQSAGALAAFGYAAYLTDIASIKENAEKLRTTLLANQSPEGWWPEYGGPDIGYLSLLVNYLSKYQTLFPHPDTKEAIELALAFITNFLHPNGTVGGEYMSRNTEYLIPSGIMNCTATSSHAKKIASFIIYITKNNTGIGPATLDDRYLAYTLSNWIEGGLALDATNIPLFEPWQEVVDQYFEHAGIRIHRGPSHYFVANMKKGGAFRLYTPSAAVFDSGIEYRDGKRLWVSNALGSTEYAATNESNGRLVRAAHNPMTTIPFVLFRIVYSIASLIPNMQQLAKNILRKTLIAFSGMSAYRFSRSYTITDNTLVITDTSSAPQIEYGAKHSYAFIPSARYGLDEIIRHRTLQAKTEKTTMGGITTVKRTFVFDHSS